MRQRLFLLIMGIPMTGLTGYGLFSVWPYHDLIGKALAALIVVLIACVIVLAIDFTWRKVTRPEVLSEGPYMVMLTKTGHVNIGAEHERAKLALPAPVTVTEERVVSAEDRDVIDRSRVLAAHFEEGKGMHKIEKELGISYDKVRTWINTAKALRDQQQSW